MKVEDSRISLSKVTFPPWMNIGNEKEWKIDANIITCTVKILNIGTSVASSLK